MFAAVAKKMGLVAGKLCMGLWTGHVLVGSLGNSDLRSVQCLGVGRSQVIALERYAEEFGRGVMALTPAYA